MRLSSTPQPAASTASYQALTAWYQTPLGQHLLREEQRLVDQALERRFGYQLLQIGCADLILHGASQIGHKFSFCAHPDAPHCHNAVARGEEIPLANTSVDLVLLHHALDYSSEPHQLLREASRVLIAGGHMVIVGFNPLSTWGVRNRLQRGRSGKSPWESARLSALRVSDWLKLLDFQITNVHYGVYVLPLNVERAIRWNRWVEPLASRLNWPTGATYVISARKQVAPLTPVQFKWPRLVPLGLGGREATRISGCGREPHHKWRNHAA